MKKLILFFFLLSLVFVPLTATAVKAQEVIPVEFKILSNRQHQVGEQTYRYPVKLHRADGYTRLRALLDTDNAEFYDVQGVTIQWIFERSPDDDATWYHMVSTTMVSG